MAPFMENPLAYLCDKLLVARLLMPAATRQESLVLLGGIEYNI